jgi:hypothetical protein
MDAHDYELTDSIAGFDEGDVLDVTARYGDWHAYRLKLEPRSATYGTTSVVVTDEAGFSEAEILDETARIGDWHEYDLTFDPVDGGDESSGRVELTMAEFERVTKPLTG